MVSMTPVAIVATTAISPATRILWPSGDQLTVGWTLAVSAATGIETRLRTALSTTPITTRGIVFGSADSSRVTTSAAMKRPSGDHRGNAGSESRVTRSRWLSPRRFTTASTPARVAESAVLYANHAPSGDHSGIVAALSAGTTTRRPSK